MKIRTTITLASIALSISGCVTTPNEARMYKRSETVPACQYNSIAQSPVDFETLVHKHREIEKRLTFIQRFLQALEAKVHSVIHKPDDDRTRDVDHQKPNRRNDIKYWW